jgi:hypothetical protein
MTGKIVRPGICFGFNDFSGQILPAEAADKDFS